MDIADLYDKDIVVVGKIWNELMQKYSHRPNTQHNLSELAKEAEDKFYQAGFIVHVDLAPVLLGEAPRVDIVDRVAASIEHVEGLDHERKRHEVLDSKVRGEDFRGQKEKYR